MTLSISTRHKQVVSTARMNDIDSGAGAGKIILYSGVRPLSVDDVWEGEIGVITLNRPCGYVDDNGLHLTTPQPTQMSSTGTIRGARITDSLGNPIMDGDVRLPTDTDVEIADFIIDTANVYVGTFVNLIQASIAEGG